MRHIESFRNCYLLFAIVSLSACAGTGTVIDSPKVDLTGVKLTSANLRRQTFLLSFAISNPNPFPLPVKAVGYQLVFDDEKFAGGKTQGSFTVPAHGDDFFAISVELDILSSTTYLTSLLRDDFSESVSYALLGSLPADIPFVNPIPYSCSAVSNMTQTTPDQCE